MDELVKLVIEKTGLSPDMAKKAAQTVLGFLKTKLPAPIAGQIDSLLSGSGASSGLKGLAGGLGGILGKKWRIRPAQNRDGFLPTAGTMA